MWPEFAYCRVTNGLFSPAECAAIVAYHAALSPMSGSLPNARESSIYWLFKTAESQWVFDRVLSCVEEWNKNYQFEIAPQGEDYLQLSCYRPGDRYDWHMDVGHGAMCTRKVSAVVELVEPAAHGGGFEIFFGGDGQRNLVPLAQGSIVVFPSWVMHRAVTPRSGDRWSLAAWVKGRSHFI